jgi:hypothetical protein
MAIGRRRVVILLVVVIAAALAARLVGAMLLEPIVRHQLHSDRPRWSTADLLVRYSPQLFGRLAAPALERLAATEPEVEFSAWLALARLDPRRVERVLERRRSGASAPSQWWRPPKPSNDVLSVIDGMRAAGSGRIAAPLTVSCFVTDDHGDVLVLFPDPKLGSDEDYWLYNLSDELTHFAGVLRPVEDRYRGYELSSCTYRRGVIEVEWVASRFRSDCPPLEPLSAWVAVAELGIDRDGDLLPDNVEERLYLDPDDPDTDSDGVEDARDLSPNGGVVPSPGSLEEAALAVLDTYWLFPLDFTAQWPVLYVASDRHLEWSGWPVPVINVPLNRTDEQPLGSDLFAFYPSVSGEWGPFESFTESRSLLDRWLIPDGVPMLLVIQHVGSDSEGYHVRLRRFNERWLVVWEHNVWY